MAEPKPQAPPRAFTQGVGTVFQFTGVILFLLSLSVCCGSSLLGKETAQRHDLDRIGLPAYSVQRAISLCLFAEVGLGIAVAGVGLGLQATRRYSAHGAVVAAAFGVVFWVAHLIFFIQHFPRFILLAAMAGLVVVFVVLLALAVGALRELRADPPPPGHEVLPPGYKIPYSWYHEDPPEVRLEKEIEERRQRLAVQQKELEQIESRARKASEQPRD